MYQYEPPLLPLPTATIKTNNNNNHSSRRPWGLVRSPSPLLSPAPSPPSSLLTHPPSLLSMPSPLPFFCFHCCLHICKPWPLPLTPPSFDVSISVVITPPPLFLQHLQPRYEITHGSPVDNGGGPRHIRSSLPLSTSSPIAVSIVDVADVKDRARCPRKFQA